MPATASTSVESAAPRLLDAVVRVRFSVATAALLLAVQSALADVALHRRAVRAFGINWPSLADGQLWRVVTDLFVEDRPGRRWSILVPFLWVPVAEWHLGWRRTVTAFFLTDWAATVGTLITLRLLSSHSAWAASQMLRYDCGTSAAIYGVLAAFTASRRGANSWIPPALVAQMLFAVWLVNRRLSDTQHLVAISAGVVLGLWWRQSPEMADVVA